MKSKNYNGSSWLSLRNGLQDNSQFWLGLLLFVFGTLPWQAQSQTLRITQITPPPNTAIAAGNGVVIVNWTGGTAPFQVQCRTNFAGNWRDVDGITYANSQTNIVTGPSAFYRVASVASFMAASADKAAPSVPSGLVATAANCSQVNLSWNASTDPNPSPSGVKGYNVYRNGVFLKQVLAPAASTSDAGLAPSTTYSYTVAAVDNAYNKSAKSSPASAMTPTCGTCTYSISPAAANPGSAAASGTLTVTAVPGCNWTPSSSAASWLTCTPATGSGTAPMTWFATANTSTNLRSGTLTIGGQTFTVTQSGNLVPVANAGPNLSITVGANATFTASGSSDADGSISSYQWNFGDGNTASGFSVSHTYALLGVYTVRLTVTDNLGATASDTALATIVALPDTTPPSANLTTPANGTVISNTITLTASASDNVGVNRVEFYCNGSVLLGTATTAPWSAPCNTTTLPNGSHNFHCKAYDAAGNAATSSANSVTVNNTVTATPGTLQWVKSMLCASGPASATGVAVDRAGNVAVSGTFAGTVDFGPGGPGPISSVGGSASSDGFVAKYNPQGGLLWVKSLGSTQGDYVQTIAVDSQDNIIVAGRFQGSIDFGGGALTSAGSSDIFVAKYAASGAHVWSKRFGGAGSDIVEQGNTVAIDGSGNVVVAAKFQGTADFGGISLSSAGSDDAGLVKLAGNDGHSLWAKRFGGSNIDVPKAVAVDKFGDVLVTGYFFASTDLGGGSVAAAGGVNDTDIFLAKYNGTDGSYRWGKRFGNTLGDNGSGITTDPNTGNIVFTGLFKSTVNFGGPAPLDSYNNGGVFLVGLDPSGAYLWGKTTGSGSTSDLGLAVRADASGNLALTGKSSSGIYFGGSQMMLGNGQPNMFVASFRINPLLPNAEPAYRWAKVVGEGTSGASQGNGVAFDASGRVLIAGSFLATIDFGGTSITTLEGFGAGFVAQYQQ